MSFVAQAMVKIKLGMSTDSSEGESGALAAVRDKLKIQQRLIDISVRSLVSCRSSSADLSQSLESQSALEVQRENISQLEVRTAMKLVSCCGGGCGEQKGGVCVCVCEIFLAFSCRHV